MVTAGDVIRQIRKEAAEGTSSGASQVLAGTGERRIGGGSTSQQEEETPKKQDQSPGIAAAERFKGILRANPISQIGNTMQDFAETNRKLGTGAIIAGGAGLVASGAGLVAVGGGATAGAVAGGAAGTTITKAAVGIGAGLTIPSVGIETARYVAREGVDISPTSRLGQAATIVPNLVTGNLLGAGAGLFVGKGIQSPGMTDFQKSVVKDKLLMEDVYKVAKEAELKSRYSVPIPFTERELPIGRVGSKGIKAREIAIRSYFQERGLKGGKLEEAVAAVQSDITSSRAGLFVSAIGLETYSELLGRTLVSGAGIKATGKGTKALDAIRKKVSQRIGIAGIAEGAGVSIGENIADYEKVSISRAVMFGAIGGLSAGYIGGKVAVPKPGKSGKALLTFARIADPNEIMGDVLGDVAEKTLKLTGLKVPAFTPTMVTTTSKTAIVPEGTQLTIKKRPPKISIPIKTGIPEQVAPPYAPSEIPLKAKLPINIGKELAPTPVRTTKSPVDINVPTSILVNIPQTTRTPSQVTPPTQVTPPVQIQPPIQIDPPTEISSTSSTSTYSPTSIFAPITVTTPAIKFPPPILPFPGGGGGGKFTFPGRRTRARAKYLPSLAAVGLGIKGKRPAYLSGLGIRPIPIKAPKIKIPGIYKRRKR